MRAVDRQLPPGDDAAVRVQPVHVAAVDLDNIAGFVRRDGAAPDMVAARQARRLGQRLQAFRVDALEPAVGRRPVERRHRAAEIEFAGIAPHEHDVPAVVGPRRDMGRGAPRPHAARRRLLAPVAAAFDRPGRGMVARQGSGPVDGRRKIDKRYSIGADFSAMDGGYPLSGSVVSEANHCVTPADRRESRGPVRPVNDFACGPRIAARKSRYRGPRTSARSTCFWILPAPLRGSSSTSSRRRGILKPASSRRA